MTYVSWATFHEGPSDAFYLDVLLPRLMEDIVRREGIRHSDIPLAPAVKLGERNREVSSVAAEACEAKDAFEILFVHADTGGRALAEGLASRADAYCQEIYSLCSFPPSRCITVTPRHETEAWILADPQAVKDALGFTGDHRRIGLPDNAHEAERISDPKAALRGALETIAGRRRRGHRVEQIFPAIAQRQNFDALRRSTSFAAFEAKLKVSLSDLGCISAPA